MAGKQKPREKVSAKRMVEERDGGYCKYLRLPPGVKLMLVKKAGIRRWDFLPYRVTVPHNPHADKGKLAVERTFYVHKDIGPNEEAHLCPAKTFGKPCPVCEDRARMARDPNVDEEKIKALKPKERQLFAVMDADEKGEEICVFDYSEHLFGKHLKEKIDKQDAKDNYDMFADADEGSTLKIGFAEEKGARGSWYVGSNIEFKPRQRQITDEILEKVPDLDLCLHETPYDKLKAIYFGESPDKPDEDEPDTTTGGDEPDEPEEKPARGKAKKDEDDEPEKPAKDSDEGGLAVGDWVEFDFKGEKVRGEVKAIDEENNLVRVKSDKRDNLHNVEPDECEKVDPPKPAGKAAKEEAPTKGEGSFKIGDYVKHPKFGRCEIIKIKDGLLVLEDDDSEMHGKVDPKEVKKVQ